jgi:apolipoprotein N-acyltransferase
MRDKIILYLQAPLRFFTAYKLPILSGMLLATSYIPFPPWGLFFSLVPLWIFWTKSDFKKTVFGTLVCSFIASFIGFYWIAITAHDFGRIPWALSIVVLAAFALVANLHLVVSAVAWGIFHLQVSKKYGLWLIPLISSLGIVFIPTLFPWNYGYAWIYINLPGAQLSDILGVVSLATVTVFINFFIFLAWLEKRYLIYGTAAVVLFVSINALGLLHLNFLPAETRSINILITQANIGSLEKQQSINQYSFRENIIQRYVTLTEQALQKTEDIDVVVWPETAYPSYVSILGFQSTAPSLVRLTQDHKVSLVTGFYDVKAAGQVANAILYVDHAGQVIDKPTHKTILLAFGEYLPFAETFPFLKKLAPQVADFIRGPGPEVRYIADVAVGPLVCYESLFPNFSRQLANQGSNIFINLTNDSWYDDWFEPLQHLYITAGRALENRRPVIRSTNTGLSTVIKSNGQPMEISTRSKEWTGVYKVSYPDKDIKTIYQRWGKDLHYILLIIFTLGVFITGRFKK